MSYFMFIDLVLADNLNAFGKKLGYSKIIKVEINQVNDRKDLRFLVNKKESLLIVLGSKFNREVLDLKNIDILLNPEKGVKEDFLNARNSGLNQVLLGLAKKNNIAIGINFNEILKSRSVERAKLLGRISQNIALCRKYKVKMVLGSFASNEFEMRAPKDFISFLITLGMHPKEAKEALTYSDEFLKNKDGIIKEGIKLVD